MLVVEQGCALCVPGSDRPWQSQGSSEFECRGEWDQPSWEIFSHHSESPSGAEVNRVGIRDKKRTLRSCDALCSYRAPPGMVRVPEPYRMAGFVVSGGRTPSHWRTKSVSTLVISASSPSTPSTSPPSTPPNLHQNTIDPCARWLVQKFGGTSVGKFAVQIARDIVSNYIDRHKVAIVCSARSGTTKALGTTNLLLKAAAEAKQRPSSKKNSRSETTTPVTNGMARRPSAGQNVPEFSATVDLIRSEHVAAAKRAIKAPEILREIEAEIERECDWLRAFLFAAQVRSSIFPRDLQISRLTFVPLQVIDEVSPRSRDSIIGFGERLACKLMTATLRDQGIDAEFVSLEDIVPISDDGDLHVEGSLDQSFYDDVATAVGKRIKECAPKVPVVTGFFGPVPGSLLRQVGRGYTDLLSALLAVGLEASELQIWKEVDGIFTADPRKVPTARLIPIISPDEAAELTYYGSEVVHPFTMEQAIRRKIPIRIKNVENPKGRGTVIHPNPDRVPNDSDPDIPCPPSLTIHTCSYSSPENIHQSKRLPTAVTIKERIVILNVNSNRKSVSHGFLAGIFGTLDRFGVAVDLISTSEVHVSMAIEDNLSPKIMDRLVLRTPKKWIGEPPRVRTHAHASEMQQYPKQVSVHTDMAILSLVGKQMRNLVGMSGRMFQSLAQGNVNIEMISQGASEINISCVIQARDAVKALNVIHQSCLQIKPEGIRGKVGPWLF
ncbi:Aspartate/glutamate/uridylate kinase [Boletus reticuloceps]|uniref:aspartate kinase n=1 Tax=Boletus reticuloceps TaxID=495285 RepID=A0A8I3ABT4_9AGAM|nr:Aspartate/glutamate/uridylate kinase [Boletus reticuloceps]